MDEEEEEEEEEKEKEKVSEGSLEWDRIHLPLHHHHLHSPQTHHRSLSDSQIKSWVKDSHFTNEENRSIVFPPINHEGLHLSSFTPSPSLSNHDDTQQELRKSSYSSCVSGGEVAKWVGIGFELLRSRVTGFASSLRHFAASLGTNWSFGSATGVAAAVLVWWLFAVFRRRRVNSRFGRETRDHLILLIKEKDEKINQLLHQIARLNQLLLALHGDLLPGTGGVT